MAGRWIGFHVTDRCQLDCDHCLRDPSQKATDLPVALVESVLDQASELLGTRHASLTGGEPTLHPHFVQLVDAICDRDMTWHIVTNGKRADRLFRWLAERPRRKDKLHSLNFSLDGATRATHDSIRGTGSFDNVMRAVTLCAAHGVPFALQMVLHARNQQEAEPMALLASQLGASRAVFAVTQPTGTLHDEELFMTARQTRALHDRVLRLRDTYKIEIASPEGWPVENPFHVCAPFAFEVVNVDVRGRLNLCCQHSDTPEGTRSDVVADLTRESLAVGMQRLVDLVAEEQRRQLTHLAATPSDERSEWDASACNRCLKSFGKPHWTAQGATGPAAQRERWSGAWSADNQRAAQAERRPSLPVLS